MCPTNMGTILYLNKVLNYNFVRGKNTHTNRTRHKNEVFSYICIVESIVFTSVDTIIS